MRYGQHILEKKVVVLAMKILQFKQVKIKILEMLDFQKALI